MAGAGVLVRVNKAWTGFVVSCFLGPIGVAVCFIIRSDALEVLAEEEAVAEPRYATTCPFCAGRLELDNRACQFCQGELAA